MSGEVAALVHAHVEDAHHEQTALLDANIRAVAPACYNTIHIDRRSTQPCWVFRRPFQRFDDRSDVVVRLRRVPSLGAV